MHHSSAVHVLERQDDAPHVVPHRGRREAPLRPEVREEVSARCKVQQHVHVVRVLVRRVPVGRAVVRYTSRAPQVARRAWWAMFTLEKPGELTSE